MSSPIIPTPEARPEAGPSSVGRQRADGGLRAFLAAAAGVVAITTLGLVGFAYVDDLAMLYLVAIMLAALVGPKLALLAAVLAVLTFNYFFMMPRFALGIGDRHQLATVGIMLGAGLAISTLTTRLRRKERDARELAAEAHEAILRARTEELRSSLLSAVSHDLRTPLAVITGAATALRDDADRVDPVARAELLDTIVHEAGRLERVLQNLLGITRVETGLQPSREWVPVEELCGTALDRLADLLGDRKVTVDVASDLLVPVDPLLFEQVLINLIENAIKHGAPPLHIAARRLGDRVEITVSDRGAGPPPGCEARIFDKFFRAPGSRAPGVGLGLAVCRGIVVAHGGTISAEAAPGGGACFRVILPAATPPTDAPFPVMMETT